MPRGLRRIDEKAALQAAMRRALEQAAAPGVVRFVVPDPPSFGTSVAQTAPVRAAARVARTRAARAIVLHRRTRKKEATSADVPPDPRGRGGTMDLRI